MTGVVSIALIIGFVILYNRNKPRKIRKTPREKFPEEWKKILTQKVSFYNALTVFEKQKFENQVQEFLMNCNIIGIRTTINSTDKILVAASAVIPVFNFDDWKYTNIHEVIIYPNSFNQEFETEGPERRILGMVGTGYMDGKMILCQQALHQGFKNESDKKNTAIHEFVHLIDKADGSIDGIPHLLLEKQYLIPWIDLINKKLDAIYQGKTDINPYGGTNRAEFFSVVSEYFFERPKLLEKKHPELYQLLQEIFNHDMADRNLFTPANNFNRNNPCPCQSGKKYKKCCMV